MNGYRALSLRNGERGFSKGWRSHDAHNIIGKPIALLRDSYTILIKILVLILIMKDAHSVASRVNIVEDNRHGFVGNPHYLTRRSLPWKIIGFIIKADQNISLVVFKVFYVYGQGALSPAYRAAQHQEQNSDRRDRFHKMIISAFPVIASKLIVPPGSDQMHG